MIRDLSVLLWSALVIAQATTPVPKPFPTTTPSPTPAKPTAPIPTPVGQTLDGSRLDARLAGIPLYPGAELLSSFDAGRGQFVFLLGTDMPYSDVVAYYKNQLRTSGAEVFRAPAIHQFDLGTFRSDTMVYRPGLAVKDYADSQGYLHVAGTTEKRFRTVIQVVPVTK